jgi:hypothetical protein
MINIKLKLLDVMTSRGITIQEVSKTDGYKVTVLSTDLANPADFVNMLVKELNDRKYLECKMLKVNFDAVRNTIIFGK